MIELNAVNQSLTHKICVEKVKHKSLNWRKETYKVNQSNNQYKIGNPAI